MTDEEFKVLKQLNRGNTITMVFVTIITVLVFMLFLFAVDANAQTITVKGDSATLSWTFLIPVKIDTHFVFVPDTTKPDTTGPYVPPIDTNIVFTRGMYIEENGVRRIIQNATTKVTGDAKIWGTFDVQESGWRSVVIEKEQPGKIRFELDGELKIEDSIVDYNYFRHDFMKGFHPFRFIYTGGPGQLKFELIKKDGGQWPAVNEWEFWTEMDTTVPPVEPPPPIVDTTGVYLDVTWDPVTKNIKGQDIAGVKYRVYYWMEGNEDLLLSVPVSGTFISIKTYYPWVGKWSVQVYAKYKGMFSDPSETVSITLE